MRNLMIFRFISSNVSSCIVLKFFLCKISGLQLQKIMKLLIHEHVRQSYDIGKNMKRLEHNNMPHSNLPPIWRCYDALYKYSSFPVYNMQHAKRKLDILYIDIIDIVPWYVNVIPYLWQPKTVKEIWCHWYKKVNQILMVLC